MDKDNILSKYTNVVRQLVLDQNEEIAQYVINANIDTFRDVLGRTHVILNIPVRTFSSWKKQNRITEIESLLYNCYEDAMRGGLDDVFIEAVNLKPKESDEAYTFGESLDYSMWENGYFRLFISHLTENKVSATNLKKCLYPYGISCFVAHEDIRVTKEWENEIENALFSMDALCAIVVPKFIESKWCDQEVGIALGRKKLVIPISKKYMPYGFFGKYQALKSGEKTAKEIAADVYGVICNHIKTKSVYLEKFVSLIINSSTEQDALERLSILCQCKGVDKSIIELLRGQYKETPVLAKKNVLSKANDLFTKYSLETITFKKEVVDSTSDDDLPF